MANDLIDPAALKTLTATLVAQAGTFEGRVDKYTTLLPEAQLPAVIAGIEKSLVPVGRGDRADFWTKAIISAYPRVPDMFSPEGYIIAVSTVLAELPDDLARETVDRVTRKLKFMPTRAEVAEVAEGLLRERRAALWRAKKMAEEHERRRAEAAERERLDRDKKEFFANGGKEKLAEWTAAPGQSERERGDAASSEAGGAG